MMIFYLLIGICLAYEIHKMVDFRVFSKMSYIMVKYHKQIKDREYSKKIHPAILRISAMNLLYIALIIIGCFGFQGYIFCSILILAILKSQIEKLVNREWFNRVFLIDSILTSFILILILVNFFFFKIPSLEFLQHLVSLVI